MGKKISIIFIVIIVLSAIVFILYDYYSLKNYHLNYEIQEDNIILHIKIPNLKTGTCEVSGKIEKIENQSCKFVVTNKKTEVEIKSLIFKKKIEINPNQNKVISLNVSISNQYLIKGEEKQIKSEFKQIGKAKDEIVYQSYNEDVCTVTKKGLVKAVSSGKCKLKISIANLSEEIDLTVTNLLTLPTFDLKKQTIPCNRYTKEENDLLDSILEAKISEAGYQTRAGVVTAIRYLTLHLPYRIPYFFENGRLNNNTGGAYIDGEGRYYKKGLYLDNSRKNSITKSFSGPSTWGCPLTNWQEQSGFIRGEKRPNGLDCSGFITWAMYNAGYDVKDTGAGDNSWRNDDLSDMGTQIEITDTLLKSQKLKAGDFIASQGHAAMIVGITNELIYVAESTVNGKGVNISKWTHNELVNTQELTYVILMSNYYKEEGNYTSMW